MKLSEESVTKYVDKKKRPESGEAWCMAFHKEKDIQILFEVPVRRQRRFSFVFERKTCLLSSQRILNLRRNRLQLSRRFPSQRDSLRPAAIRDRRSSERSGKAREKKSPLDTLEIIAIFLSLLGGAGEYEVVRCGEAGHNIRSRPNLKGTPVGLLCRTNRIKASEHVRNSL